MAYHDTIMAQPQPSKNDLQKSGTPQTYAGAPTHKPWAAKQGEIGLILKGHRLEQADSAKALAIPAFD